MLSSGRAASRTADPERPLDVVVLSDIHANLEALDAVLEHARTWDEIWFLGDIVGYGPDPQGCYERLRELGPAYWLAGNHDWAAIGRLDISSFNPDARAAAEWTMEALDDEARAYLEELEPRRDLPELDISLVHGSPRHPIWEYVLNAVTATENFPFFDASLCLFGHTHVPVIYEETIDGTLRRPMVVSQPIRPEEKVRWMANPGGVGQPRDGDPRASYVRLDLATRAITLQRVPYDFGRTQEKILAAGLPERLAARLAYGW